jgi:hypothetical protein
MILWRPALTDDGQPVEFHLEPGLIYDADITIPRQTLMRLVNPLGREVLRVGNTLTCQTYVRETLNPTKADRLVRMQFAGAMREEDALELNLHIVGVNIEALK